MNYRLRLEQRPPMANGRARGNPRAHASETRAWRQAFQMLARAQEVPTLEAVEVVVRTYYPNRRSLPDCAGPAPAAKAALDGVVDAGVLVDDGPAYCGG